MLAVCLTDRYGCSLNTISISDNVELRVLYRAEEEEPVHASTAIKNRYEQLVN